MLLLWTWFIQENPENSTQRIIKSSKFLHQNILDFCFDNDITRTFWFMSPFVDVVFCFYLFVCLFVFFASCTAPIYQPDWFFHGTVFKNTNIIPLTDQTTCILTSLDQKCRSSSKFSFYFSLPSFSKPPGNFLCLLVSPYLYSITINCARIEL